MRRYFDLSTLPAVVGLSDVTHHVQLCRHTRRSARLITLRQKYSCRQAIQVLVIGGHSALSCMRCSLVSVKAVAVAYVAAVVLCQAYNSNTY